MAGSPVPAEALAPSLQPLGAARMLPGVAYTSADVIAWERRHLFAGSWACLGRADEVLGDADTQRALVVGDVPVLLTRVDGVVRGVRQHLPASGP